MTQEEPTSSNGSGGGGQLGRPLPRLLERLRSDVGRQLTQEFGYTSPMQIPRLDKVVLNIGMGEALQNARAMEAATTDLTAISGQKPVVTKAKRSIAQFKIRDGMPIGLTVTLRGRRMYEFYDRLVNASLPRIRDFQGCFEELIRRKGQLLSWTERAGHLSRDRLQLGGPDARLAGGDSHYRSKRPGGDATSGASRNAVYEAQKRGARLTAETLQQPDVRR